jgi:subtilisin family serine protease
MNSKVLFKLFSAAMVAYLALSLAVSPQPASAQKSNPIKGPGALMQPVTLPAQQDIAKFPARANGTVDVMLELTASPSSLAYVDAVKTGNSTNAASSAAVARFTQINAAQQVLVDSLNTLNIGATVLYRVQAAYNGVAVTVKAESISALAGLPGLKAVHLMVPKYVDNSSTVPMINAPFAWEYATSYRGTGIRIGVIDTGIDYLHTDFGGPGTPAAYAANNTTIVGDAPNYPGPKVAGGYDFAGDAYTGYNTPSPDFDPMDCAGHGSHVAGTIAGYGVNADGTTYTGAYGPSTNFAGLRVGPGVAPDAKLYALRVFGCSGSTDLTTEAIDRAVDPNGDGDPSDHLDVINMSLGSAFGSTYDDSAVASENASQAGVIVVASAGNSYDTHYDVGAPSVATSAISVAAIIDPLDIMDGFEVVNNTTELNSNPNPHPNDVYGSFNSVVGWASVSSVTADLVYPATNRGGCSAFTPGQFTGKIALLDWTYTFAPADTSECGSGTRVLNAFNAGAVGVLFANTKPYLDILITGNANIPSTITTLATGNIIKARLAVGDPDGDLDVMLTTAHNGTIRNVDPTVADSLASFSSRGPRRLDSFLKPDIAAPGMSVFSVLALSGNKGTSMSGTSMAAPHMTGVMALLRQLHPNWTSEELKALAMNTATHDVTTVGAGVGDTYAGPRVGAGRVDVQNAFLDNVIAYNSTDTGAVSVSFGSVQVPVESTVTLYKDFVISNKNGSLTAPLTFHVAYEPNSSLLSPGVSFSVVDTSGNPVTTVTLASGAQVHLQVKMTANGVQMNHTLDTTMYNLQGTTYGPQPRYYMTEAGGNVTLSVAGPETNLRSEMVRMPVYAVARPVSNMQGDASLNLLSPSGSAQITLSGTGINTGTNYPTDVLSLASALELKAVSPKLTNLPDPIFSTGDYQYVGVMSDRQAAGSMANTTIYFGISTYGNWSTPSADGDEYNIWIDTNLDGSPDVLVFNYRLTADANGNPTDVFVTYVEKGSMIGGNFVPTAAYYDQFINGIGPSMDTSVYNTNVMVMPVDASLLGLTDANSRFNFWLDSNSREWPSSSPIDTVGSAAQPLRYDAKNLAIDTIGAAAPGALPLFEDLPGDTIPFTYNKANALDGILGVLLLHHQNGDVNRAEVVLTLDHQAYIPFVSKTTPTEPGK